MIGASDDHVVLFQANDVVSVPGLERGHPIRRRRPRVELPRLGDRTARELGAADTRGKSEVVLDPARRAGLPAQCGAFDDQRFEAL